MKKKKQFACSSFIIFFSFKCFFFYTPLKPIDSMKHCFQMQSYRLQRVIVLHQYLTFLSVGFRRKKTLAQMHAPINLHTTLPPLLPSFFKALRNDFMVYKIIPFHRLLEHSIIPPSFRKKIIHSVWRSGVRCYKSLSPMHPVAKDVPCPGRRRRREDV